MRLKLSKVNNFEPLCSFLLTFSAAFEPLVRDSTRARSQNTCITTLESFEYGFFYEMGCTEWLQVEAMTKECQEVCTQTGCYCLCANPRSREEILWLWIWNSQPIITLDCNNVSHFALFIICGFLSMIIVLATGASIDSELSGH